MSFSQGLSEGDKGICWGTIFMIHVWHQEECPRAVTSCLVSVCVGFLQDFIPLLAVSLYSLFICKIGLRQRKDLSWICHVVLNKQSSF